jgi:hypothetical protein
LGAAGRQLVARGLRLARPQVGELGLQRQRRLTPPAVPDAHRDADRRDIMIPPRIRLGALGGLVVAY